MEKSQSNNKRIRGRRGRRNVAKIKPVELFSMRRLTCFFMQRIMQMMRNLVLPFKKGSTF
jgi:hypothetical protein